MAFCLDGKTVSEVGGHQPARLPFLPGPPQHLLRVRIHCLSRHFTRPGHRSGLQKAAQPSSRWWILLRWSSPRLTETHGTAKLP